MHTKKIQPKVHKAINIQKVNQFKTQYTAVTGKCKSIHNTNNAQECIPIHNAVNTHVKKKFKYITYFPQHIAKLSQKLHNTIHISITLIHVMTQYMYDKLNTQCHSNIGHNQSVFYLNQSVL